MLELAILIDTCTESTASHNPYHSGDGSDHVGAVTGDGTEYDALHWYS